MNPDYRPTTMEIQDILKQFKNIQPDPTYTEFSRRAVLASAQLEQLSLRRILARVMETAGSVALVGLLIFAIMGGFSGSRYLSPVQFSGIDPAALHAEAQAIDMQINLANLTYTESTRVAESTPHASGSPFARATTTASAPPAAAAPAAAAPENTATSTGTGNAPSSSVSINEALQKLTQ